MTPPRPPPGGGAAPPRPAIIAAAARRTPTIAAVRSISSVALKEALAGSDSRKSWAAGGIGPEGGQRGSEEGRRGRCCGAPAPCRRRALGGRRRRCCSRGRAGEGAVQAQGPGSFAPAVPPHLALADACIEHRHVQPLEAVEGVPGEEEGPRAWGGWHRRAAAAELLAAHTGLAPAPLPHPRATPRPAPPRPRQRPAARALTAHGGGGMRRPAPPGRTRPGGTPARPRPGPRGVPPAGREWSRWIQSSSARARCTPAPGDHARARAPRLPSAAPRLACRPAAPHAPPLRARRGRGRPAGEGRGCGSGRGVPWGWVRVVRVVRGGRRGGAAMPAAAGGRAAPEGRALPSPSQRRTVRL
jgi:hypothetical protein